MEREIRRQKTRMLVVTFGILGLVAWNIDFVLNGIMSNIYLNGTIILVFLFGFGLVFRHVFDLEGEQVALRGLKEAFSDAKIIEEKDFVDEYWRHHRCMKPGVVYERPKLLGHIFELTHDEILRTNKIRISLTTMQSLVDGIDTRIVEQRSLATYLTGLLVFLGLIGTFIGLMDMVASVGGIIGSLASATDGGGDQSAAFAKLVQDLKGPLIGMATGFSSSLFGLFGSLMLGLLSRFGARASNALKLHFEEWLAGVAQIENEEYVPEQRDLQGPIDEKNLRRLTGSVIALTEGFEQVNNDFLRTMGMVERMADAQVAQNKLIEAQTERLESLAQVQHLMTGMAEHMQALMAGFEKSAAETRTANSALRSDVSGSFERLSATLQTLAEASAAERRQDAGEREAMMRLVSEVQGGMKADMAALNGTLAALAGSSDGLHDVLSTLSTREDALIGQAARHHREMMEALSRLSFPAQPAAPAAAASGQVSAAPVSTAIPAGGNGFASKIEALEAAIRAAREGGHEAAPAAEEQLIAVAEDARESYARYADSLKRTEAARSAPEPAEPAPQREFLSPMERLRALYGHRKQDGRG